MSGQKGLTKQQAASWRILQWRGTGTSIALGEEIDKRYAALRISKS